MRPLPQGQSPDSARNSGVFPSPGVPQISTCSPARMTTCRSRNPSRPTGESTCSSSNAIAPGAPSAYSIRLPTSSLRFGGEQRSPEVRHAQQRGSPIRDRAEVVDEPAQRSLRLAERGRRQHHAAERGLAGEVQRRRDEDRRDACDPAESRRHPSEIGEAANEPAHRKHDVADVHFDAAALVGLACGERDAVDVLADADERETQVRLARVAVGVAPDQAPAHEIAREASPPRHTRSRPTA